MERFARALELTSCYVAVAMLIVLLGSSASTLEAYAISAAAANTDCVPPAFYSFEVTAATVNTPWSVPLLSSIDGAYVPTVAATGLPPGITLQDQRTTLQAGGSTLHNWVLAGSPTQLGTYAITVTAQNTCGGTSTIITLPINSTQGYTQTNTQTVPTQACPAGTVGTYPNCTSSTAPTVSFDTSSLISTASNPTITGTSNTASVSLTVQNSNGAAQKSNDATVVNGHWSVALSGLQSGLYTLYLYSGTTLLLPAKLTVAIPSTSPLPTVQTPASTVVQPTSTTTAVPAQATTAGCLVLPSMQQGGSGNAVVALQQFLIQQGLLAPGNATGYFGPMTRAAVGAYQVGRGVVSSPGAPGFGIVGPNTRASLQSVTCSGGGVSTTPVQPMTRISCPRLVIPPCPGGSPVAVGVDTNGCTYGYKCVQSGGGVATGCTVYTPPVCSNGNVLSLGTDVNGCSLGYYCQQVSCFSGPIITSCPAGQTLISGTDKYGCPNVSYCSGGGSATTTTTTSTTNTNNTNNYFGSTYTSFIDYYNSLFGGNTTSTVTPTQTSTQQTTGTTQQTTSTTPAASATSYSDALSLFNTFSYTYGHATVTKCTRPDSTTRYLVRGFNSTNTSYETRVYPSGATSGGSESCTIIATTETGTASVIFDSSSTGQTGL
jgi:hypothetical protein